MKWLLKRKLLKLLSESELALNCLSDINIALMNYLPSKAIPLFEVLDIYKRRFAHTKEIEFEISGFPELMVALENETESYLKIHMFSGRKYDFIAFSDRNIKRLIGILQFEKEN
jgi:hypothetical protein